MGEYKEVPIAEAEAIANKFGKDQVLIFAYDHDSEYMHTTTWGRSMQDKLQSAKGGDLVASILSDVKQQVCFSDFRVNEGIIDESERQMILLALAELALSRPGWDWTISETVKKFGAENATTMWQGFKETSADRVKESHAAPGRSHAREAERK